MEENDFLSPHICYECSAYQSDDDNFDGAGFCMYKGVECSGMDSACKKFFNPYC